MPRRDVDRYIDNEALLTPPAPTHATTLTEVLHIWNTDPRYLGPYGVPLEIDFDTTPGRRFTELVRRAEASADAVMVLDDLVRSGVVVMSGERYLKVTSRSYVIADLLSPQALEYFGATISNLARTLEHNMVTEADRKLLQRSVIADRGLPKAVLPEFEAYVKLRAQQMLAEVDDWHIRRYTPNGMLHTSIKMPFKKPTSLIFGGANLDILYVTSMRFGLTEKELLETPLSGSLVAIKTGFKGLPVNLFKDLI